RNQVHGIHRCDLHHQITQAKEDDPETELDRDVRVLADPVQIHPKHAEERSKHDDEERIEELRRGSAHLPTEHITINVPISEQRERSTCLLETGPENNIEEHKDDEHDHAITQHVPFLYPAAHEAPYHEGRHRDQQDA